MFECHTNQVWDVEDSGSCKAHWKLAATDSMDRKNDINKTRGRVAQPLTPRVAGNGQSSGGQAALRRRLALDPDIRHRSVTGAILWVVAAALGAVQQYGPNGVEMSTVAYFAFLAVTSVMALLCLFVGPRLTGRRFQVAEEFVIATGWVATAALVATTGGASSPDIGIFANTMFYCAYFMTSRRALRQVLTGTVAMWLPLAYNFNSVVSDGFIARALVMTAVLWAMAILVARNRHNTERAEMRARRLALTDPLTGAANLRTFEQELRSALAGADPTSTKLGVAFVDVNGLKAANTVFGHAGGDELIRRTGQALMACASYDDQVARVGGDELAVLIPGADADQMKSFEAEFAIALSEAGRGVEALTFDLSASIGTAVYPQDGRTLDDLMAVADERMYDSKTALPPRLPTPETSGGRSLSDQPIEEHSRFEAFVTGSAPAASLAWLLGGGMIVCAAAFTGSSAVHLSLALVLSGICIAVAGCLGLVSDAQRSAAEGIGNTLAVAIAVPVIYATGGATTPILPLVYLVVAHAAYADTRRAAALRTAAVLGVVGATLAFNASAENFTSVAVVATEVLLIAVLLHYNRRRTERAERQAIELSRTDPLTKLANRRVFERTLAELAEARAEQTDLLLGGLILVDVDNFKTINTSGGHKSGDEVLRMIAAVLEGAIGNEATVCRIGGDEFAVIVRDGDHGDVMRAASKCKAAVGSVDWNVLSASNVTLSLGFATWEHVDAWKDLVIAADLALQQSKDAGKNAVRAAQTPAPAVPSLGSDELPPVRSA